MITIIIYLSTYCINIFFVTFLQVANSDLPQTTADDDQNLEIDALTPSINNYQPQLVSETLKHDALQKDHEYDLYHSETEFLDAAGSSNSTKK